MSLVSTLGCDLLPSIPPHFIRLLCMGVRPVSSQPIQYLCIAEWILSSRLAANYSRSTEWTLELAIYPMLYLNGNNV